MDKKFNKIIQDAKDFSLTENEKKLMLEKISTYMKMHPKQNTPDATSSPYLVPGYFSYQSLQIRVLVPISKISKEKYISFVVVLFVLLSGTALAAGHALPGEILYPVKLGLNERVELALALGDNNSAVVEAKQANERLEEAEKLSLDGDINPKLKNTIQNNFNGHADRVRELVSDLRVSGQEDEANDINSNFESVLKVHNLVLAKLVKDNRVGTDDINAINGDVNTHLDKAVKARTQEENKVILSNDQVSVKASAEGSQKAALKKVGEVEKYVNAKRNAHRVSTDAKLNNVKETIAEGQAKINQGDYRTAFILFRQASRNAEEVKLLLNSENKLNIEVDSREGEEGNRETDVEKNNSNSSNGGNEYIKSHFLKLPL